MYNTIQKSNYLSVKIVNENINKFSACSFFCNNSQLKIIHNSCIEAHENATSCFDDYFGMGFVTSLGHICFDNHLKRNRC